MNRDRFLNEVLGALVSVVFSFVPFSPVLGGGVSGYLVFNSENEGEVGVKDGFYVGVVSGLFASIPLALVSFFLLGFLSLLLGFGFGWLPDVSVLFLGFFILFYFVFVAAYTVLLSGVGGGLGVYLAQEWRGSEG